MSEKNTILPEAVAIICPGQGFWLGNIPQLPCGINESIKEATGIDLIDQCKLKGKEVLGDTRLSQLLSLSVGCSEGEKRLAEIGITEEQLRKGKVRLYLVGHSVGEYTALVLARSISFSKAVSLVWSRSGGMQDASKKSPGRMSAILGKLKKRVIRMACRRHDVSVAADNSESQLVVSGGHENMDALTEELAQNGHGREKKIDTEGPFHSPLMGPALKPLKKALARVKFKSPSRGVRFISTATGKRVRRLGFDMKVKTNLADQLVREVMFRPAILYVLEKEPNCLIVEAWPFPVLSSAIKSCKEEAEAKRLAKVARKKAALDPSQD